MKVLLLDAALGMTPSKEWKGRYDANGGYLVVRMPEGQGRKMSDGRRLMAEG